MNNSNFKDCFEANGETRMATELPTLRFEVDAAGYDRV